MLTLQLDWGKRPLCLAMHAYTSHELSMTAAVVSVQQNNKHPTRAQLPAAIPTAVEQAKDA